MAAIRVEELVAWLGSGAEERGGDDREKGKKEEEERGGGMREGMGVEWRRNGGGSSHGY